MPNRMISLERNTNETQIDLTLDLYGTGRYEVEEKRHSGAPLRRAPHPELAAHHHWHIGTDEDIREHTG